MMQARIFALFAIAALSPAVGAATLACYEEPGSRKTTCIDESAVTVNGDIRSSPLFSGGPKGVTKTSAIVLVDCKRNVMTMQDRAGVNFAGGPTTATAASRALSSWVCQAPKPRKDPKLRQF